MAKRKRGRVTHKKDRPRAFSATPEQYCMYCQVNLPSVALFKDHMINDHVGSYLWAKFLDEEEDKDGSE